MANDIFTWPAPVGGLVATSEGGVLKITPNPPLVPPDATGDDVPIGRPLPLFDVGRWQLIQSFGEQPIAKSGMLGATSTRRTGYAYTWECDVILDLRFQVELALRGIRGAEIFFREQQAFDLEGVGTVEERVYWCPLAHVDSVSPVINAAEKRQVRQHVTGTASCHVLLLPEFDPDAGVAWGYKHFLKGHPHG